MPWKCFNCQSNASTVLKEYTLHRWMCVGVFRCWMLVLIKHHLESVNKENTSANERNNQRKILRRGIHDSNVLAGETIRSCRNVIQKKVCHWPHRWGSLYLLFQNTLTLWTGLLRLILIIMMSVMRDPKTQDRPQSQCRETICFCDELLSFFPEAHMQTGHCYLSSWLFWW